MKKLVLTTLILPVIAVLTVASYSSRSHPIIQTLPAGLGAISGVVLDESGKPIAEARVYARIVDEPIHGGLHSVLTDKKGNFLLDRVLPGLNAVHAFKEEDGYPDTFFAVYYATNPSAVPRVTVFDGQVANVVIQLGPKATNVALDVSDSDSGDQISGASVELSNAEDPSIYVSLSCREDRQGKCHVLIPAQPIRVKMKKQGYEDRDITEEITSQVLGASLQASEKREIAIRLRRSKRTVP
jgi:Carboxypeptidase regulatory-like domain